MNKKAVEMNIATIIVVILAILVLVIVALYFTGGMKTLWGKITPVPAAWDITQATQARSACTLLCSAQDKTAFCEYEASIDQKDSEGNVVATQKLHCWQEPINAQKESECISVGFDKDSCE